ncbi:Class II abasic (AP) endonuclease [Thoreauomyces humboldtii]|nr:Class II abasic (AP) endonuclease [Thoreauomyces humboldtii]
MHSPETPRPSNQYHPWCEQKDYAAILATLDADIACFQEMKIARTNVTADLAMIPTYDAFFTFPKRRHGYAGSTTYVRHPYTPVDAEEGFTGATVTSRGQVVVNESGIGCYGTLHDEFTGTELAEMDGEGRVVITDHRLFVLINAYFPVDDPEEDRQAFRLRFYRAMRMRIEALIAGGRQVILLGDINACCNTQDHCDPKKSLRERGIEVFWDLPARSWLRDLIHPRGPLLDAFRVFHPEQEKAFTCWNTLINARPVNYGTRIDYILPTPGLRPWLKDSAVEADVMGSDHCPVSCLFHDKHPETGEELAAAMTPEGWTDGERQPPPLCVKYWDAFSGTQQKLSAFFSVGAAGKGAKALPEELPANEATAQPSDPVASVDLADEVAQTAPRSTASSETPPPALPEPEPPRRAHPGKRNLPPPRKTQASSGKRKKPSTTLAKSKTGNEISQTKIAHFFARPPIPPTSTPPLAPDPVDTDLAVRPPTVPPPTTTALPSSSSFTSTQASLDSSSSSQSQDPPSFSQCSITSVPSSPTSTGSSAASAWRTLLTAPPPPHCHHDEPAKQYRVNKTGPNQKRLFWLCARPVGPERDTHVNGEKRDEVGSTGPGRRRDHVVGDTRCDYFQWFSAPKRK